MEYAKIPRPLTQSQKLNKWFSLCGRLHGKFKDLDYCKSMYGVRDKPWKSEKNISFLEIIKKSVRIHFCDVTYCAVIEGRKIHCTVHKN
jgi:hypothetical protein